MTSSEHRNKWTLFQLLDTYSLHFQPRLVSKPFDPRHEISNIVVCATRKGSDQPAHTRRLIRDFLLVAWIFYECYLLPEHHLQFLSLKETTQARLSLHLSKCHIVANHKSWLIYSLDVLETNSQNVSILTSNGIVNSEIFARFLFSRNFANAKLRESKILAKWQNRSVVYWYR